MKKSVIALILLAVLVIIVSPGIVGKLAENSVDENLNWAAQESGELIVTSESFDRGWFSSEGQHRVELGNGSIRAAINAAAGGGNGEQIPVLLINTHIDHGLIPVSSMGREEGSLAPGLGRAVSTLAVDFGAGETIELPGSIYSEVGLGGKLDSKYILDAGELDVEDGKVSWQPTTINIASSAKTGNVKFDGNIGAMTFGNDQQTVSIDGLTVVGEQAPTPFGFNVGEVEMTMGAMTIDAGGVSGGGLQGIHVKGSSSVDDELAAAAMRLEMSGQAPGFGDVSYIADIGLSNIDAAAVGAISQRLNELAGTPDPSQLVMAAENEFKDLFAAGLNVDVNQFDVALPMGTVEMKMAVEVPESDRATFEWPSLLLDTVASADIRVPEALVQFATSMNPQAGAIVGMGYLKKEGDTYVMAADYKKGLLTINGAPVPIPMGAFQ